MAAERALGRPMAKTCPLGVVISCWTPAALRLARAAARSADASTDVEVLKGLAERRDDGGLPKEGALLKDPEDNKEFVRAVEVLVGVAGLVCKNAGIRIL